jgi:hypothetical protein
VKAGLGGDQRQRAEGHEVKSRHSGIFSRVKLSRSDPACPLSFDKHIAHEPKKGAKEISLWAQGQSPGHFRDTP